MNLHQVGMVISNGQGKILDVNEVFTQILGYTREECLSGVVNWETLTPPDQRHLSGQAIACVKRSGVHPPFEKEFFDKQGNRVSVLVQTTHLKGSDDVYLGLIIDHKAQKQREMSVPLSLACEPTSHAVNASTEHGFGSQIKGRENQISIPGHEPTVCNAAQARLPLVSIGACFFDKELRYIHIDPVLASINGFSIEQHLGRTFRELLPTYAAQYEPLLQHVLNTGEPLLNIGISGEIPGEPGSYGCWLGNYYPVQVAEGQIIGVSVTVMEITRFRHVEDKAYLN